MGFFAIMIITGVLSLTVAMQMSNMVCRLHYEPLKGFDSQEHSDLFRRLLFYVGQIKQS